MSKLCVISSIEIDVSGGVVGHYDVEFSIAENEPRTGLYLASSDTENKIVFGNVTSIKSRSLFRRDKYLFKAFATNLASLVSELSLFLNHYNQIEGKDKERFESVLGSNPIESHAYRVGILKITDDIKNEVAVGDKLTRMILEVIAESGVKIRA